MFKFELEGGSSPSAYYTEQKELKFNPPVFQQRYSITVRILEHELFKGHIRKVVDFGCAELRLLELLKRLCHVQHILEVDIDEELLITYAMRAKPLITDYINRRESPLRVDIYKGSVDYPAKCLQNADAVIGIELIEHLYPQVLENVPYNIFGFIRPKLVILSTPNSEYNVLFNLTLPNGFRHDDHKFEWTREQFRDWAYNICTRFPNYQVAFLGAGDAPITKREVGHVTQIAVFVRNDLRNIDLTDDMKQEPDVLCEMEEYKLLYSVDYPVADKQTSAEKLLSEVKYHISRHISMRDEYFREEADRYEIPIGNIFEFVYPQATSVEELKNYLVENKYQVDNNMILIEKDDLEDEDNESFARSDNEDSRVDTLPIIDPDEMWD